MNEIILFFISLILLVSLVICVKALQEKFEEKKK